MSLPGPRPPPTPRAAVNTGEGRETCTQAWTKTKRTAAVSALDVKLDCRVVDRGYYCVDIPGNYTQSRTDVGDRACSDENKDTACALKWSLRIKYHLQN